MSNSIASIDGNKVNLKQINAGETETIELKVEPLEASKESQQAQQLEYAKTGAMTLAELNKLYFGLI